MVVEQTGPDIFFTFRVEIGELRGEMRDNFARVEGDVQRLAGELARTAAQVRQTVEQLAQTADRLAQTADGMGQLASHFGLFQRTVDHRFDRIDGVLEGVVDAYGEQAARLDLLEADREKD